MLSTCLQLVVILLLMLLLVFVTGLAILIHRTAHPARSMAMKAGAPEHPFDLDWPCEELQLQGCHGNLLKAWLVARKEPKALLILLHGHRKDKRQMLERSGFLYSAGYALLFLDHRHHGESEDAAFGLGYFGRLDLARVIEEMRRREAYGSCRIFTFGISLGASTALAAACDGLDISAVIADSPSSDQSRTLVEYAQRLYCLPEGFTLFALSLVERWWSMDFEKMNLFARLSGSSVPVLIIHSEKDARVPISHARRLAGLKRQAPLELLTFSEGGHGMAQILHREVYERKVLEFLEARDS